MKCETCNAPGFIFPEMYCNACPDKLKPKIKTGRAYLYKKYAGTIPVCSVDIKAEEGAECEVSAVKLMSKFRVEFIEAG